MAFILGKKIGMTQIFQENGTVVPLTLIEAKPIMVTQIRSLEKNGYQAVQIGYDKAKKMNKPKSGHLKDLPPFKKLKEFRNLGGDLKRGDNLDISSFNIGDIVKVSGFSKGRGFQGAVKRHGFAGMPASHGHHHVLRHVGSIGQRFPQHTLKGMRMAGRMGNTRKTIRGLKVILVDIDNNILGLKGAVPGRKGTILEIATI